MHEAMHDRCRSRREKMETVAWHPAEVQSGVSFLMQVDLRRDPAMAIFP
jgi:hypothetical protein